MLHTELPTDTEGRTPDPLWANTPVEIFPLPSPHEGEEIYISQEAVGEGNPGDISILATYYSKNSGKPRMILVLGEDRPASHKRLREFPDKPPTQIFKPWRVEYFYEIPLVNPLDNLGDKVAGVSQIIRMGWFVQGIKGKKGFARVAPCENVETEYVIWEPDDKYNGGLRNYALVQSRIYRTDEKPRSVTDTIRYDEIMRIYYLADNTDRRFIFDPRSKSLKERLSVGRLVKPKVKIDPHDKFYITDDWIRFKIKGVE